MSRLPLSGNKTLRVVQITVAALVALLLIFLGLCYTPAFHSPARSAYDRATQEAGRGEVQSAVADYQLADFLNPSDHTARHRLADLYVTQNKPEAAIDTLRSLPIGESGVQIAGLQRQTGQLDAAADTIYRTLRAGETGEAYAEKARLLLEKGDNSGAAYNADRSVQLQNNDEHKLLLGICYAVTANSTDMKALMASVGSPEPLQALTKASQGKGPLAVLLYSAGLPRSAERVLNAYALTGAAEYRLLGKVQSLIAQNDHDYWAKARTNLEKAAAMDPANLDGHKLLLNVYQNLNLKTEADQQQTLIDALVSGKV